MNRNPNFGLYAVAVAIAVVGVLWLEVPVADLVVLAVVLACPLMMIFMMRGMSGRGDHHSNQHDHDDRGSHYQR